GWAQVLPRAEQALVAAGRRPGRRPRVGRSSRPPEAASGREGFRGPEATAGTAPGRYPLLRLRRPRCASGFRTANDATFIVSASARTPGYSSAPTPGLRGRRGGPSPLSGARSPRAAPPAWAGGRR